MGVQEVREEIARMERQYNRDQLDAISMARRYLTQLSKAQRQGLKRQIRPYLRFRGEVAEFQKRYFSEVCTQRCFTRGSSACCGREGIATFFADVVLNLLLSTEKEVDILQQTLSEDQGGLNCVYLTQTGCLWRLKPIVCEMFLCEHAKASVFARHDGLRTRWEALRRKEKRYTWPSRPVLFDEMERLFIQAGFQSPLMYFHRSPGLVQVKARFLKQG